MEKPSNKQGISRYSGLLIPILISSILGVSSYGLIKLSENVVSKEEINKYEVFCSNASEAEGTLDEEYTEITSKIGKVKIKIYEYKYFYTVDGVSYEATYTVNSTHPSSTKKLWYNKKSPQENSFNEPCEELAKLKTKIHFGNKDVFLLGGLLLGLMAVAILLGALKGLIVQGLKNLLKK